MFYGFLVHWSALIIFFAVGLLALWLANKVAGKYGLYIFSVFTLAFCNLVPSVMLFNYRVSIGAILVVLAYLALILSFHAYGRQEAARLLVVDIIILASTFIFHFITGAVYDAANGITLLRWYNFGPFIATMISFVLCSFFGSRLIRREYSYINSALTLSVATILDSILFVFICQAFLNMAITDILLLLAIRAGVVLVSSLIGVAFLKLFIKKEEQNKEVLYEAKDLDAKENVEVSSTLIQDVKQETTQEEKQEDKLKEEVKEVKSKKAKQPSKKSTTKSAEKKTDNTPKVEKKEEKKSVKKLSQTKAMAKSEASTVSIAQKEEKSAPKKEKKAKEESKTTASTKDASKSSKAKSEEKEEKSVKAETKKKPNKATNKEAKLETKESLVNVSKKEEKARRTKLEAKTAKQKKAEPKKEPAKLESKKEKVKTESKATKKATALKKKLQPIQKQQLNQKQQ